MSDNSSQKPLRSLPSNKQKPLSKKEEIEICVSSFGALAADLIGNGYDGNSVIDAMRKVADGLNEDFPDVPF